MAEIDDPVGMRLSICVEPSFFYLSTSFGFARLSRGALTGNTASSKHSFGPSLGGPLGTKPVIPRQEKREKKIRTKNLHFTRLLITRNCVISTHLPRCAVLVQDGEPLLAPGSSDDGANLPTKGRRRRFKNEIITCTRGA